MGEGSIVLITEEEICIELVCLQWHALRLDTSLLSRMVVPPRDLGRWRDCCDRCGKDICNKRSSWTGWLKRDGAVEGNLDARCDGNNGTSEWQRRTPPSGLENRVHRL